MDFKGFGCSANGIGRSDFGKESYVVNEPQF
jgi:hypothetical protein